MKLCLTIGIVMPIVSASWKPSVPSSSVRTCPVRNDDRDRVHHRVADRRDEVGRAGTARADRHADLAGRLRVALRGVAAARLVADEDVVDSSVVEGVVGGEVGAAGQAEYDINTLSLETFHQSVDCTHGAFLLSPRTRHLSARGRSAHGGNGQSTSGFASGVSTRSAGRSADASPPLRAARHRGTRALRRTRCRPRRAA